MMKKNRFLIFKKKTIENVPNWNIEEEDGGGRTLMVGLKLDQRSRELLTWVLVKVAKPSDRVIALHVLSNTEIVDQDGKSSLLSLVKALDSVLAVYEGFCNLKQVDLKLKICRGNSIRKVLVRETKSYIATKVIVGTATKHHGISSLTSVARYCASKLSKDCCVLAFNNGKIVFQRDSTAFSNNESRDADDRVHGNFFSEFRRSWSKKCRLLNTNSALSTEGSHQNIELACPWTPMYQNCSVCAPNSGLRETPHRIRLVEESLGGGSADNSMALIPIQTLDAESSSISLLIREIQDMRPGWPLLCGSISHNQQAFTWSRAKEVSVGQWARQPPDRISSSLAHLDHQESSSCDWNGDHTFGLNGETGTTLVVKKYPASSLNSSNEEKESRPHELDFIHEKFSSGCRLYRYQELQSATSNFLPETLIGKGGSSQVYKGCLPDGQELAVKILNPSEDVFREFIYEIEIVTGLHHKNIISLLGFCFEDTKCLLVYDFLPRGSLEENLHGNKEKSPLGWGERYKVALGVAKALDYLHVNSEAVIHGDVKSSNILLSDDYEPKLSDFGLAKWASTSASHITCTEVAGTFGYLAPEYFMYGTVNDKIDVYAFGVVLLELLSGRKPIDNEYPKGQESLIMWAKLILNAGKIVQLLDRRLGDSYNSDQMQWMVLAATLCIRREPRSRPRMHLISTKTLKDGIMGKGINFIPMYKSIGELKNAATKINEQRKELEEKHNHEWSWKNDPLKVVKLLKGDAEVIKWSRLRIDVAREFDEFDQVEEFPTPSIQSHLNLALHDVEDGFLSNSSLGKGVSGEEYLLGRWSRS